MERKRCKRPLAAALTTLALFLGTALSAAPARAESGTVYTCAMYGQISVRLLVRPTLSFM